MKPVSNWANRTSQKKTAPGPSPWKILPCGFKALWKHLYYTLLYPDVTLEHPPFIDDFPSELTSIYFEDFPASHVWNPMKSPTTAALGRAAIIGRPPARLFTWDVGRTWAKHRANRQDFLRIPLCNMRPPLVMWMLVNKSPRNTIVISTINHSYWSYKPT